MPDMDKLSKTLGSVRDKLVVFNGVRAVVFDEKLSNAEIVSRVREYYEAYNEGDPKL